MQRAWLADFDHDPLDGLATATVRALRLAFSRRHMLVHNEEVIDERYRRETREGRIGLRVPHHDRIRGTGLDAVVALAGRLELTAL